MISVPAIFGFLLLATAIYQTFTGKTLPKTDSSTEKVWMILALYLFALVLIATSFAGD